MSIFDRFKSNKTNETIKVPVICIYENTENHTFSTYISPKYADSAYVKTMLNRIMDQLSDYRGLKE